MTKSQNASLQAILCYGDRMARLSSIESEFGTTEEAKDHDQWFRAKVLSSLADQRPTVPHDEAMKRIAAIIAAAERQSR